MCGEHAASDFSIALTRGSSPRVRGTQGEPGDLRRAAAGSSPRVRGTQYPIGRVAVVPGIIPACAGNTYNLSCFLSIGWDHPRVCGEHALGDHVALQVLGIIPACAGNTPSEWQDHVDGRDHPRVCGEHTPETPLTDEELGSSPRVRGTQMPPGPPKPQPRIIPACAGNTEAAVDDEIVSRDHPRVCGEHAEHDPIVSAVRGSSPRVRGTPTAMMCVSPMMGIIPACAGNTSRMRSRVQAPRDHPRVCGEHKGGQSFDCRQQGSSPRVRGTPDGFLVRQIPAGIIPACAGNTVPVARFFGLLQDHPRVCGEHKVSLSLVGLGLGSSPRVRGTPS